MTNNDFNTSQILSSFVQNFLDDIIELFTAHPEMDYLYKELFFPINENKIIKNRNPVLEHQICMIILTKTSEQVLIIDLYSFKQNIKDYKNTLIKILNNFFKSPIFKNVYLHHYKPYISGPLLINFIEENFGF